MPRLLDGIEVTGPFNPTGISRTPSRALIFVCDPKDAATAKPPAPGRSRKTWRGARIPAAGHPEDDMNRLMPFYEAGRRDGGTFDQGIEQIVAAVLVSPDFLYRSIRGPTGRSPDTEFALTDLELASRLSFFLWNTGPDEELLKLAAANGLTKPGVMDKQVKRMLADPRASSLVTSFAMKWLNLTNLDQVDARPEDVPRLQRPTAARFLDGSRSVHRQHLLGEPERGGTADLRPYVPEQPAGPPLRYSRRHGRAVPQGHAHRDERVSACWAKPRC